MAVSGKVGSSFVEVEPKLSGNFKSIIEKEMPSGSDGGRTFGNGFSEGMKGSIGVGAVAVGNILSDVVKAGASAAKDFIGDALSGFADYEQLAGGVKTLFDDAGSTVMENAKQAFATAGMSANEYMENVTSFSASLISSLEGDTAKAAEVADKAMVDMSDNANKMGTDMESITNAYQGFAKQNYTMLDNLKLGYGGTQSEMERLLADASAIAGVEFSIDSYADVIEAIHVMQESMGITGATMQEGATTISGSLNMLNGAWSNFLAALGDGGQTMDLSQVTNDLITSLEAVASNVLPAIGRIGASIAQQFPEVVSRAMESLPGQLEEIIASSFGDGAGSTFGAAMETLSSLGETVEATFGGIVEAAAPLVSTFQDAFSRVSEAVSENMPEIGGIMANAGEVIEGLVPIIQSVVEFSSGAVSEVIRFAAPIIEKVTRLVADCMPQISSAVRTALGAAQSVVNTALPAIKAVFDAVWPVVSGIVTTAVGIIKGAIEGISSVVSGVTSTFKAIGDAISSPIETAKKIVSDAISAIEGFLDTTLSFPEIRIPTIHVDGGEAPWGIGGQGKLPEFWIEWAAKGGIVDGATLIGAGERGPEAIVPLSGSYMAPFADAIADRMNGGKPIQINLNYDASADAQQMAWDLAREVRRLELAGVV